jgi:hypothetical protein
MKKPYLGNSANKLIQLQGWRTTAEVERLALEHGAKEGIGGFEFTDPDSFCAFCKELEVAFTTPPDWAVVSDWGRGRYRKG